MEELIEKLKDILEVDELDLQSKFSDYETWDSFSILSVLALIDSTYHKQMTAVEVKGFATIADFCKAILD